jgi:hypothetical protein
MPLTPEEKKEALKQLHAQIDSLPLEQKAQAQVEINSLSDDALEAMVEQQRNPPPVFRKIISKEIPSVEIGSNSKAIAVLSTKSISKGHTIIIPREPLTNPTNIPNEITSLSEEVSKKLLENLKPKSTDVIPEKAFGEIIINIIPIYNSPLTLQSERKDISIEELNKLKKQLDIIKIHTEPKIIKVKKKKGRKPKPLKLSRRVP